MKHIEPMRMHNRNRTRVGLDAGLRWGSAMQRNWLPDMDLNHDKQIQSLLCYRYTIGQPGAALTVGKRR